MRNIEDIKFRVWDKEAGHFIIPYEGEGYDDIDITYADGEWYITGGEKLTDDRYALLQYTRLKDKNGRDIYEGDILEITYGSSKRRTPVLFGRQDISHDWQGVGFYTLDRKGHQFNFFGGKNVEVIGNVFENPELKEKCEL